MDASGDIAPAGPAQPLIVIEELFTGCFGGGPGRLDGNWTDGMLTFHTGDMFPNKVYHFDVLSTKDPGRETMERVAIDVTPAAAPEAQIV